MPAPLILDFETYYSDEYSLKKMTPVEYILDRRFEAIGCAVKEGLGGQSYWVEGPELPGFFARQSRDVWMISHNILFDGCIAAWRYGFVPRLFGDTLGMARAVLGPYIPRFSLDRVASFLGLGSKIPGVLHHAKGRGFESIRSDANYYLAYVAYALNDADKCAAIFRTLLGELPAEEYSVIDMLVRAVLRPAFVLDKEILDLHLGEVLAAKSMLLDRVGLDRGELLSNEKFAGHLRSLGVPVPMKTSPVTGRETYALAKNDEEFLELLEHENPAVQALVAARLGIKSTIEETRTRRFINISLLTWPTVSGGLTYADRAPGSSRAPNVPYMPVPLRYGAAHTHRFGGEWDLNMQNLGRGGKLRKSLKAPPGYKVVKVDASQIEARLTAYLADETILLDQFERGVDPYCEFGTSLFGFPVTKADVVHRTLSKSSVLGCGFQMGPTKFMKQVNAQRLPDGEGGVIAIDMPMAERLVYGYRHRFWRVPRLWRTIEAMVIPCLAGVGGVERLMVGPIVVMRGRAILPSLTGELGKGLTLTYRDLTFDGETGEWTFAYADGRKKIYPGKVVENFVQALDRVLVIGAAVRLRKELDPFILQHQGHDENCYVVPEDYAPAVAERVRSEMAARPHWGPDLPLAAEARIANAYG